MEIKVCGPGCPKCEEAEKLVRETAAESNLAIRVEKVTDFQEIAKLGVFSTPAVVIDGQIKCAGKVTSKQEIANWLKQ